MDGEKLKVFVRGKKSGGIFQDHYGFHRGKMDSNSLNVSTVGSASCYSPIRLLNNSEIVCLRDRNSGC